MSRLQLTGVMALVLSPVACDVTAPDERLDPVVVESISPMPGAGGVDPAASVVIQFSREMADGGDVYMDIHRGGPGADVVDGHWNWSADHRTATFHPAGDFADGSLHTIHMGPGLETRDHTRLNLDHCLSLGGVRLDGTVFGGGMHHGEPGHHHGRGWMDDGGFGVMFTFTTR